MNRRKSDRIQPAALGDYIDRLLGRMIGNFRASCAACDVDAIHDLRVAVKRLRAVFGLVKSLQPRFRRKRAYLPLRDLYRAAGGVRDFQVQQQLFRLWITSNRVGADEFSSWLTASEQEACQRYLETTAGFDPGVVAEAIGSIAWALNDLPHQEVVSGMNRRFNTLFGNLLELDPVEELQPSSLHSVRIRSKETRYCLEIIRACTGSNETVSHLDAALKRVHRTLGVWHDYDVGLRMINTFHDHHSERALWKRHDYRELNAAYNAIRQDHLTEFERVWQQLRDLGLPLSPPFLPITR
jgi:CHAD domain-containing protein